MSSGVAPNAQNGLACPPGPMPDIIPLGQPPPASTPTATRGASSAYNLRPRNANGKATAGGLKFTPPSRELFVRKKQKQTNPSANEAAALDDAAGEAEQHSEPPATMNLDSSAETETDSSDTSDAPRETAVARVNQASAAYELPRFSCPMPQCLVEARSWATVYQLREHVTTSTSSRTTKFPPNC